MVDSEITYIIAFVLGVPPLIASMIIIMQLWFDD